MFEITYLNGDIAELANFLCEKLDDHAKQFADITPVERIAFFMHDDAKRIIAGCTGNIIYGCLFLNMLWVDEKLRGQKLGTRLVQAAEELASKSQCGMVCIRTMNWQALDFYKKLGYFVELTQEGFVDNSTMYYLRKNINKN
jgi:GNAT superfamily N-acetyltransferase